MKSPVSIPIAHFYNHRWSYRWNMAESDAIGDCVWKGGELASHCAKSNHRGRFRAV